MQLDESIAMLRDINKGLAAQGISEAHYEAPLPKPIPAPKAPDDAHLDPSGRRYLVKSFTGGKWDVDARLVSKAIELSQQHGDTPMLLAAKALERGSEDVRHAVAQRERDASNRVAPGAFVRDMVKAYVPGQPLAMTGGSSPPSIVMGPVRRDARTGEIDADSVVTQMIKVFAAMTRNEPLSSQEQVLLAIAYPDQVEVTDPLAAQALALVTEDERAQLRAVYEARLLEIIGYAQMKFGYIPGQAVTLHRS